jgi:hypothetical protein
MRIAILILSLCLVTKAAAQAPHEILRTFQDAFSKFVPAGPPTEQRLEQPIDPATAEDSPEARRQALWESATKIQTDDDEDPSTTASTQPTGGSPHTKEQCIDPAKFRPGQIGYLDYHLFKIVDIGPKELYLEGEDLKEPFCLTGINTEEEGEEEFEKSQLVAILGYVMVRGTRAYETEEGDKHTVRVVKLLNAEESEFADAQRAILEAKHPVRTWTSKDGKHKIEARFLKFAGGKVHLANAAGKSITISPNALSTADRAYYRDLIKKARDEARRKTEPDEDAEDQAPIGIEGETFR